MNEYNHGAGEEMRHNDVTRGCYGNNSHHHHHHHHVGSSRQRHTKVADASFMPNTIYRVAPKWHIFCTPLLHQILTDFQNCFTVRIRKKNVIILSLEIPLHLKCVATLPCKMSSVLKATIENKTTSVTTHFKEINNREQRVYYLSYCIK